MQIFVSGSLAYDRIMDFPGRFADHILPEKIHILNVCFMVNGLTERFGGTAGNIAYNLALLEEKPVILATAGQGFRPLPGVADLTGPAPGRHQGDSRGIHRRGLHHHGPLRQPDHRVQSRRHEAPLGVPLRPGGPGRGPGHRGPGQPGGHAGLHPGLQGPGGALHLRPRPEHPGLGGRRTPGDGRPGPGPHRQRLRTGDVPAENRPERERFLDADAHSHHHPGRCGLLPSHRRRPGRPPGGEPRQVLDPTGAGDAYRAGLLKGLALGLSWSEAVRMGAVLASFCVEEQGTQEHRVEVYQFWERYQQNFGTPPAAAAA